MMNNERKELIAKYLNDFDNKGYEINEELKKAILLAEFSDKNVIISGSAGTGKSTFIELFRHNSKKNIVLLAPTGVAAVNIGGVTIHNFFKMHIGIVNKYAIASDLREIVKAIDVIIIDEISMVRADLMDAVDYQLRVLTSNPNKPFGGIKIVAVGDLFQIPPVVVNGSPDEKYIKDNFDSPWFFSAPEIGYFTIVELNKIYRQNDEKFIEVLNRIRVGQQSRADLMRINRRVIPEEEFGDDYIYLTTTNKNADKINWERLKEIQEQSFQYYSFIEGDYPQYVEPAPSTLTLKKGAQVMLLKNRTGYWYNGQLGTVVYLDKDVIKVSIDGKVQHILKEKWANYDYELKDGKITLVEKGSYTQFPLKLAYAITIHKSQSKTYDKVYIDLGNGAFSSGQTYVALSRCKSLEGIGLKYDIDKRDIIVDKTLKKHFL